MKFDDKAISQFEAFRRKVVELRSVVAELAAARQGAASAEETIATVNRQLDAIPASKLEAAETGVESLMQRLQRAEFLRPQFSNKSSKYESGVGKLSNEAHCEGAALENLLRSAIVQAFPPPASPSDRVDSSFGPITKSCLAALSKLDHLPSHRADRWEKLVCLFQEFQTLEAAA